MYMFNVRVHVDPYMTISPVGLFTKAISTGPMTARSTISGRRQEVFQGRAPGESREGYPAIFQTPGGRAQPRFFVTSMVKMKESSGQGGMALPC